MLASSILGLNTDMASLEVPKEKIEAVHEKSAHYSQIRIENKTSIAPRNPGWGASGCANGARAWGLVDLIGTHVYRECLRQLPYGGETLWVVG